MADLEHRRRFIVVGGGIAGMVVARRLVLGGRDVLLIEEGDYLGGTVARQRVGGIDLDAGAESFATRGGTVAQLAVSLGLGGDIVSPNPDGAWLQPARGAAFRLPENSLLGIPAFPLARDVTAIIGYPAAFRALADALMPAMITKPDTTLGELVRRRMGNEVLDKLVRPIVRGVHSADANVLKIDSVAPGLRSALDRNGSLSSAVRELRQTSARAGSAVAGISGGVVRIADALRADLERFGVEIRLGTRVTGFADDHVLVEAAARDEGIADERIDGEVVIAAPGLTEPGADRGHRVVLATLVVDQPLLDAAPRGTGVLVAEGRTDIRARALTHSTAKWAWLAERAAGKHVVRLSYDAEPDGDLATIAREDAAALLGVPLEESQVVDFARVAWYRPNRLTHTPDGIRLAGESIAGTGLASVVAQAEALAARLLPDAG
ncbi:MAG TPA: FAD-dependent oxidoreductase [Galbitalea sp.]